jgi:hypothetical protein
MLYYEQISGAKQQFKQHTFKIRALKAMPHQSTDKCANYYQYSFKDCGNTT